MHIASRILIFTIIISLVHAECYCFPEKQALLLQYHKHLNNDYIARKTGLTIVKRLAGQNTRSYDMVPFYAARDLESYQGSEDISCRSYNCYLTSIIVKRALDKIAKPCPCE